MKRYVQTYRIGKRSSTLNRKVKRGSWVFLNGLLLRHGFDYVIRKRNVKFTELLEIDDIIEIEEQIL